MAEPNPEELVLLGIKSYEKQDFSKAKGYFEKACDLNNGGGCNGLGVLYRDGQGAEKNLTKASQYFSKACDLNNNKGCFNLGALYLEKDSKKAVALFEKACKLGYKKACEMLKELR
ncbi:tetratricopeptide repeat protein [Helicobacter pylori]|uniref:tetratricopeptide repeat protein n=1 Tax=Helicobacter pylori TaxID=210 RepID=UPI001E421148|nr:sel1 repeat family protein [Helicobacter pylori]